ncbi:MAG: orotidine-5'-phosphate decarboxylase [Phycisphaeraceae bacterium]|nr:orotidine-5'-phosphate decarboxylase [Phycisphaeraceae bacterium]
MSGSSPPALHVADRLHAAIDRLGTPACVGLDPVLDKLPDAVRAAHHDPVRAIEHFCIGVLDALSDVVPIVKPQSACFERYGPAGVSALRNVIIAAHNRGLLVILDAKRGDIGISAEHYAVASFGRHDASHPAPIGHAADFLTVNAYLGFDTVEPYLPAQGASTAAHGIFVLVRTSNPASDRVQGLPLADGRTVAEMMADEVAKLGTRPQSKGPHSGISCVGAVVGATKSSDAESLRRRMPDSPFLVPGYGAQGGTLDDIRPMLRSRASPADSAVIVNASRSVIFAGNGADWQSQVRSAAARFADELRALFH